MKSRLVIVNKSAVAKRLGFSKLIEPKGFIDSPTLEQLASVGSNDRFWEILEIKQAKKPSKKKENSISEETKLSNATVITVTPEITA